MIKAPVNLKDGALSVAGLGCLTAAALAAIANIWFVINAARHARRAKAAADRAAEAARSISYEEPMRAQPTPPWPAPHVDTA